ncbi:hypothetical protein SAMN06298216_3599 [Spirosomataceae bacterium TFI 002]|nr:hypothetical protein SAMN06298216_3599 [Spirosomataceae bacterium TFI 002]
MPETSLCLKCKALFLVSSFFNYVNSYFFHLGTGPLGFGMGNRPSVSLTNSSIRLIIIFAFFKLMKISLSFRPCHLQGCTVHIDGFDLDCSDTT